MNNFLLLPDDSKRFVVEQTALLQGLYKQVIEKDLWVSTVLEIVFTLPYSDKLVFKGGTSLGKVWGLIERFSEDIDLAVDRSLFGFDGELTIRQIKKLRKASSLFVRDDFCNDLKSAVERYGLSDYLEIEAQEDGEGDKTYPEPRQIFIKYKSLFDTELSYVKPQIILEIGSRSLFEPTQKALVASMITSEFPEIQTSVVHREITTAVPGKTFLEKAFLLHELFTTAGCEKAERKSRHLYDLEKMMDCDFALAAINDDNLWEAISNHREKFTHVNGVDYSPDVRDRIVLTPPAECLQVWEADYVRMQKSMIYGDSLSFDALLGRMRELEERFHMNAVERRFSGEMKPKTSFV